MGGRPGVVVVGQVTCTTSGLVGTYGPVSPCSLGPSVPLRLTSPLLTLTEVDVGGEESRDKKTGTLRLPVSPEETHRLDTGAGCLKGFLDDTRTVYENINDNIFFFTTWVPGPKTRVETLIGRHTRTRFFLST